MSTRFVFVDGGAKLAYNVTNGLGTMTPYMVAGAVGGPVAGYSVMFLQGVGSSMSSALREGKSYTDSLLYGVTSATMELVLSAALGAAGGALGQSVLGKTTSTILQKGLAKMQGHPLLKKMIQFGGESFVSGLGEGLEETLQAYINPMLREVYFDENVELNIRNADALYNGLVGMIIGVLVGNGKSSAVTSTQLLSGTTSENIQVAQALCEATQGLPLNSTQQQLVKDTLADIEHMQNGDVNADAMRMLEMQVQQMLNIWHQTNLQAKANKNTNTATPSATTEISLESIKPANPTVPPQTDTKINTASPYNIAPKPDLSNITDLDIRTHEMLAAQAPTRASIVSPDAKTSTANTAKTTPTQPTAGGGVPDAPGQTTAQTHIDPELANVIEAATAGVEGRQPNLPQQPTTPLDPETARLNEIATAAIERREPNLPNDDSTPPVIDKPKEREYSDVETNDKTIPPITPSQKQTIDLFKQDIVTTRASMKSKHKKSGNIAFAKIDIPGVPSELKAFSRVNKKDDVGAECGFVLKKRIQYFQHSRLMGLIVRMIPKRKS